MPAFHYTALHAATRREIRGTQEGDSPRHVRQQLRTQGLLPLTVTALANNVQHSTQLPSFLSKKTMNQGDLCLFTRQLATLLTAGMPLEESLKATAEQAEKTAIKNLILAVRSCVLEGHPLAAGLSQFPRVFSSLYCATIASGEQSGHLDKIMHRLADYVERQQELRQKIQQALIYPLVMTTISLGIVIFLLTFVVPKMVEVFTSTEQELPLMTTLLINLSHIAQTAGPYVLALLVTGAITFPVLLQKKLALKIKYHHFLLTLPLIGKSIRMLNTARFSRTLGILSGAGVPVIEAMTTAAALLTSLPMKSALEAASVSVSEGAPIHRALKQTTYFPPMSLHLIATGESSGQLEAMLERSANTQEQEIERRIDILLSLFEPFLILTMGAVVLFIVLAVLLPIFSLNQFVG